jgi:acyl-CoA thioesterase I
MNKTLAITAILLLTGVGCWFFGDSGPGELRNHPPVAAGPWIAFGDSLTEGLGAERGEDYPAVFARLTGIKIKNLGISGNTTQDGLARIGEAVQLKPRVVLLCLGGNDTLRQIPREVTFENLGTMIDRFHGVGSFVVLIGVQSASLLRDKNYEHFEALAKEKQVLFLDNILDGVLFNRALMSDQIHPNRQGLRENRPTLCRGARALHPATALNK